MVSVNRFRSTFIRSIPLQALAVSVVATVVAWALWSPAPATFTALDRHLYDTAPRPSPVSPSILLIARDASSEGRFGTGPWDRALIATLVRVADDAGAAVIGVDLPVAEPSPPHLGGAVSDTMLNEATKEAGTVLYPLAAHTIQPDSLPIIAQQAKAIGHLHSSPDADHLVRTVPLFVTVGDQAVPAFGFALATHFLHIAPGQIVRTDGTSVTLRDVQLPDGRRVTLCLPVDRQGRLLLNFTGTGPEPPFTTLPFSVVWDAVQTGDEAKLQDWMKNKVVLLLPQPAGRQLLRPTPNGTEMSDGLLQAHLLNTLLTQRWGHRAPPLVQASLPLLLSGIAAWVLLALNGWKGPGTAFGLLAGYGSAVLLAATLGWMLPLVIPVSSLLLVLAGATVWTHFTAGQRVLLLERDMLNLQQELIAVREALVVRENAVERLEEDLDAARSTVAQSADKQEDLSRTAEGLRLQIADARAQENATRQTLQILEAELQGLRSVRPDASPLDDVQQERLRQECAQLGIITRDPQMLGLFQDVKKGARSPLPVLILGEPGTGKELFARAVHRLSSRAGQPFLPVNMAAISPELFESELFGHVRGSFTGAMNDRKGYFEMAHRGTIFLDEIGDLRLDHQAKLLRVLQDKTFYRIGATTPTTVDVRIVAATNKDLQRGASEGWFREDLYFRLKGLVLRLPSLRERPHDLAHVAEHCLHETGVHLGREGLRLSQDALSALARYEWKGNVRELRQCLEQAAALAEGSVITTADLRLHPNDGGPAAHQRASGQLLPEPAGDDAVLACLRRHEFDMQATARALRWDRSTVTQRLKGLCFQALVESGGDQAKAAATLAGEPANIRTVELKLIDYYGHLLKTIQACRTPDEAILDCKRRFKNLPDRHFRSVEMLIRQHFATNPTPLKSGKA